MLKADPKVTVSIILLTMNQRATTLRCLESLMAVQEPNHRILLWDNGSNDGTIEAVNIDFPEVIVHYHPTNAGVASGRNLAVAMLEEQFTSEFLFFLDILPTNFD